LNNYNSGLSFDRLGATYFLIRCEIATFVWVATHTMGTTGFNAQTCQNDLNLSSHTSRCKVRCADDNFRTRCWDGQKTKLPTTSRDAEMNTAGSTSAVNFKQLC